MEEVDAHHARMQQRVTATAEVIVEALTRHGLQLRTKDDQVATVSKVAERAGGRCSWFAHLASERPKRR
ncbi:hypothetical protein K1W54_07355 [Micromonospora sp. CPCC 205371]|nr:hypothetical protein [Micromonospora sp. CPCC 205371]